MTTQKSVSIMVIISREQRDALKRVVAEKTLQDFDMNCSVSSVCRQIIADFLEQQGSGNRVNGAN